MKIATNTTKDQRLRGIVTLEKECILTINVFNFYTTMDTFLKKYFVSTDASSEFTIIIRVGV